MEAKCCHEVFDSCRYGRYFGNLWYDRCCHYQSERYSIIFTIVKKDDYSYQNAYAHMASGLVCGFSCVVYIIVIKAAGYSIGVVGDVGIRANAQQ